jgi:hypothetical protein
MISQETFALISIACVVSAYVIGLWVGASS